MIILLNFFLHTFERLNIIILMSIKETRAELLNDYNVCSLVLYSIWNNPKWTLQNLLSICNKHLFVDKRNTIFRIRCYQKELTSGKHWLWNRRKQNTTQAQKYLCKSGIPFHLCKFFQSGRYLTLLFSVFTFSTIPMRRPMVLNTSVSLSFKWYLEAIREYLNVHIL